MLIIKGHQLTRPSFISEKKLAQPSNEQNIVSSYCICARMSVKERENQLSQINNIKGVKVKKALVFLFLRERRSNKFSGF